ncbi:hypothetical protein HK102_007609 [Quaeritorhiza haematococci]|nr:hypothetical protein HK102_007609 [Quaeritorhiza haematococci]
MTHLSDYSYVERGITNLCVLVWIIYHINKNDHFASLRWQNIRRREVKTLTTCSVLLSIVIMLFYDVLSTRINRKVANATFVGSTEFKTYLIYSGLSLAAYPTLQFAFISDYTKSTVYPQIYFSFECAVILILCIYTDYRLRRITGSVATLQRLAYFIELNVLLSVAVFMTSIGLLVINIDILTTPKLIYQNKLVTDVLIKIFNTGLALLWVMMILILYPNRGLVGGNNSVVAPTAHVNGGSSSNDHTGSGVHNSASKYYPGPNGELMFQTVAQYTRFQRTQSRQLAFGANAKTPKNTKQEQAKALGNSFRNSAPVGAVAIPISALTVPSAVPKAHSPLSSIVASSTRSSLSDDGSSMYSNGTLMNSRPVSTVDGDIQALTAAVKEVVSTSPPSKRNSAPPIEPPRSGRSSPDHIQERVLIAPFLQHEAAADL